MAISRVKLRGKIHYQAVLWKDGLRAASKTFSAKSEAADWLAQQYRQPISNFKAGFQLTLNEFFEKYYWPALRVSPGSAISYLGIWQLHLKPRFGECRLVNLDSQTIILAFNKMQSAGTSPARLNRIRTVLSGILSRARKVGINIDPLRGVDYIS